VRDSLHRPSRPHRPLTTGETAGLCGGLIGTPVMVYTAANILCSSGGLLERFQLAAIPMFAAAWGAGMVITACRNRYDVEPH
jgi:hypothetical protein